MRVPLHIVEQRRERLRNLIRHDGFLPVAEICRRLGISEATARRDLAAVEASGDITRTYGGALADYNTSFASIDERAQRSRPAKSRIAAAAARLIPSKGAIFLDAGTTIVAVARTLAQRRNLGGLVVATNNLAVATVLSDVPGVELHVIGGMFLDRQAALLGRRAIRALDSWEFSDAFLGGEGMDAEGVSNSHPEIAEFQRALLGRATKSRFCLDASKLGRSTPNRVAPWSQISTLITDTPAKKLAAAGIVIPAGRLTPA